MARRTRRNPAYIADLRWRDLPALAPVVVATLKDPVAMIEAAAKGVNPRVTTMPYAAMFADKIPPLPVLDLWCWAYLNTSPLNSKDAQKRAERAVKAAYKASLNPLRVLYAVLAVLADSVEWMNIKQIGDHLSHAHIPRREAFVADMAEGRKRGLDLPDWITYEVDEGVVPSVQDSIKAAMRELERL